MYVRDLKQGMLLQPKTGHEWSVNKVHQQAGEGWMELLDQGVLFHCTVRYIYPQPTGETDEPIAVYMGKVLLNEHYYGLKTHHLLLINGEVSAVDGYGFSDVEKV